MKSLAEGQASPLAFLIEAHLSRTPTLLLVTGPRGAGKTTWCHNLVTFAREHNWSVAGLLSPAVMAGDRKMGIDLHDLKGDQHRRLATRTQSILVGDDAIPPGGVTNGQWSFDPHTICWGNQLLSTIARPDLLIIDELGPLEFRQGQGLQAGLKLIDAWRSNLICVTIRPSLIGVARMRWPWSHILVVEESPLTEEDSHD